MSTTVTENEHVAVVPPASVTRKVFVVAPTEKDAPLGAPAICVVVAPEQLSVPFGAVYVTFAAQSPKAAFTLIFAGQVIVGAWLSITVTVNVQVDWFPEMSVATPVTVVVPEAKVEPEDGAVETETRPGQLSLAVGSEKVAVPVQTPGDEETATLAGQVINGSSLSFTVIENEQVAVNPEPSVTRNVLTVVPIGKVAPDPNPPICTKVGMPQLSEKVGEA